MSEKLEQASDLIFQIHFEVLESELIRWIFTMSNELSELWEQIIMTSYHGERLSSINIYLDWNGQMFTNS